MLEPFPSLKSRSRSRTDEKFRQIEQRYLLHEPRSSKSLKFPTRIRQNMKRDSKWVEAAEPSELSPTQKSMCRHCTSFDGIAQGTRRGNGTTEKRETRNTRNSHAAQSQSRWVFVEILLDGSHLSASQTCVGEMKSIIRRDEEILFQPSWKRRKILTHNKHRNELDERSWRIFSDLK